MLRLLLGLAYLGLVIYALTDVAQQPSPRPLGLPKVVWVVLIVVLPLAGSLGWLVAKYLGGEGSAEVDRRPMAPDDDPDYLRWLEQQRRRDKRDRDA